MPVESRSKPNGASALDHAGIVIRALRLHHWLKNALLFVPAVVAQSLGSSIPALGIAFLAFGCVASAHYLINDLFDKDHDRHDLAKRRRPQAAGQLSPRAAVGIAIALLAVAAVSASRLPLGFQAALAVYLLLAMAYSLLLKRVPVLDVLTLTVLYDLRLAAGASAAMVPLPATLLLAGSLFFLAMALLKRMTQLAEGVPGRLPGRPYEPRNLPALRILAGAAAVAAVLTSARFLAEVSTQVARPLLLWLILLVGIAWLGRCFVLVDRKKLNEDLVLFVLGDRFSNVALVALALLVLAAG